MRRNGYSPVEEELATGVVSLAVPVYDNGGRVVAALNISSHSRQTAAAALVAARLAALQRVSKAITRRDDQHTGARTQRAGPITRAGAAVAARPRNIQQRGAVPPFVLAGIERFVRCAHHGRADRRVAPAMLRPLRR